MGNRSYEAKPFVILFFVAILGQSMLLNAYFFMLVILFILYENKSELKDCAVVK